MADDKRLKFFNADSYKQFIVSRMHTKGKQYIEHFSTIKMRYKIWAITIIGALLLALSFIAGFKEENVHIDKIHFLSALVIITVIGLNLIRYLDVYVSHEQIRMLFQMVMEKEKGEKSLSKPYMKIAKILYSEKFDPVLIDFLYYCSLNVAILTFGTIVLISKIQPSHPSLEILFSLGLLFAFMLREVISLFFVYKRRLHINQ